MLKIQKISKYRTKNGTDRFVYAVSGSKAEIKQYEEIQGEYFTADKVTGEPLFFTSKFVGNNATLALVTNEETGEKYYRGEPSELNEMRMQLLREEMQAETGVTRTNRVAASVADDDDDDEEADLD